MSPNPVLRNTSAPSIASFQLLPPNPKRLSLSSLGALTADGLNLPVRTHPRLVRGRSSGDQADTTPDQGSAKFPETAPAPALHLLTLKCPQPSINPEPQGLALVRPHSSTAPQLLIALDEDSFRLQTLRL